MTQIALLTGADPRRCKDGPVVRLRNGTWQFVVEHQQDSKLGIFIDRVAYALRNGMDLPLIDGANVQVVFIERGQESFINVFARLM